MSGGEAQRVKLSKELSKRATDHTLYILDEPSVGLHAADVHKLVEVLNRLVDQGNTVLIIEHHPDIIKVADWLIDWGRTAASAAAPSWRRARRNRSRRINNRIRDTFSRSICKLKRRWEHACDTWRRCNKM